MIRQTFIATAFMLTAITAPALAADAPPPTLTATGEGSASAAPDIAVVTLGVVSESDNAKDALAANAKDMTSVIAAITGAGVAEKDIATTGLAVEPVYSDPSKDPNGRPSIVGYRVVNQVTVRIRELAGSGPLLDKVMGAGANRVTGIGFDIDQPGALRDEATKKAIAEARRKAELMAEAAGVKLGDVLSVSTSEGGNFPMYRADMAMKAAPTPVMGGEQAINVNATLTYKISPR